MREEILGNIDNPRQLEKLYRSNKSLFRREFAAVYPELKGKTLAGFWNERLNYESDDISWGSSNDLLFVVFAIVVAGLTAKIPDLFSIDREFFYPRNIGFIIFPVLTGWFAWKNKVSAGKIAVMAVAFLAGLIFINFVPGDENSDTFVLSCIHLVLFLWAILGFSFTGGEGNSVDKRLGYVKYNGDLLVMTALIVIAGGIMTAITIGLFSVIGINIEKFYFENVVVFGLPAAPILATYLTQTNPHLVGKVSPVIARIFSPLVLVMLVIYLTAMSFSGKDPYNDREFLIIFNALLAGVMAIIFFSVAGTSKSYKSNAEVWILFLLSVVTILVNGIALSAILFRISEWGITPNRAAVLGGNVLILINLLMVTARLFRVISKKENIIRVGQAITWYLPVYVIWAIIVTFLFPLIFGFR
jgi:hypothetical protein